MLQRTSDYQNRKDLMESVPSFSDGEARGYSVDLRELVQILSRRRWIVILSTLALLVLATVFLLIVTPRYTATATVLIDPHRSSVVDSNSNQPADANSAADDSVINSQVSLIQSVAVLQRVVSQLNLARDPEFGPHSSIFSPIRRLFTAPKALAPGQTEEDVAKATALDFLLRKRLKVARDTTTFVINVDVSSEDPEKAAKIANAIVDSYFSEQVRSRYDTQKIAASWFNKQIEDLKSQVLASDKAVEEFKAAHSLTIAQGSTLNDQQLGDLNNKLIESHVQTAEARAKFEQVQNIVKTKADPGTLAQALSSDVIARMRTSLKIWRMYQANLDRSTRWW